MTHSRTPSGARPNVHTPHAITTSSSSRPSSHSFSNSPATPNSPLTPLQRRPSSSRSQRSSSGYPSPRQTRTGSGFFEGSFVEDGARGGTLADELGGWDEDEEEFDEYDEDIDEGEDVDMDEIEDTPQSSSVRERDSGIDVASPPVVNGKRRKQTGLGIHESEAEDTDEDGEDSEVDAEELRLITANLEARLAAVESLAKRGTGERESHSSRGDDYSGGLQEVITRTTESLKDLGAQSGIETGVNRLVTTHTAISTHLAHQTLYLQRLASLLFSPLNVSPISTDLIDDILPTLSDTLAFLPTLTPDPRPSESLRTLTLKTSSLIQALATVSDSINIVNQTPATAASRSLRAVRETLRDFREENRKRDDGVRYIEQGCWNQRLANRECRDVCGEVLGGFEEELGRWREWLIRKEEIGVAV